MGLIRMRMMMAAEAAMAAKLASISESNTVFSLFNEHPGTSHVAGIVTCDITDGSHTATDNKARKPFRGAGIPGG